MHIIIDNIYPRRDGGEISSVVIHFTARAEDGSINFKGSLPVADFNELIDFKGIESAVKTGAVEKIMNEEIDAE